MSSTAYKKSIGCIGTGMLFFLLFFNLFAVVVVITSEILSYTTLSERTVTIIYYAIYAVGYVACFLLPGKIMQRKLRKHHLPSSPVASDFKLSKYLPLLVLASVTVIIGCAYFNSMLMEVFNYSVFSTEVIWSEHIVTEPYMLAINVIVIGFVPGLAEEYLFRGVICENLMPYGKGNAIFISALFFGLMHQNGEQILFAFCAGILLGLVYEKTHNIWNCTIIHAFNNIFTIIENFIVSKYPGFVGNIWAILFEAFLFGAGAICLCYLLIKFFSEKKNATEKESNSSSDNSFYGKELPESENFATMPIDRKTAVKGFFRPTVVVFLVFVAIEVIYLILVSMGVMNLV